MYHRTSCLSQLTASISSQKAATTSEGSSTFESKPILSEAVFRLSVALSMNLQTSYSNVRRGHVDYGYSAATHLDSLRVIMAQGLP